MAVSFTIEKRLNKQGEAPVRCSISIQGHRLQTTTMIAVKPEFWDPETQRVLSSTAAGKIVVNSKQMSAKQMNAELKRIDTFFSEYENTLRVNHEPIGDLKEIYAQQFGRKAKAPVEEAEEAPDIREHLKSFLAEQNEKNQWRTATQKSMKSFSSHMNDFFDAKGVTAIDYFDEDGTTQFVNFLLEEKGLRNSTIDKYTSRLRYFLRWAVQNGYSTVNTKYRPRLQMTKKKVVFLEWKELMKLYKFDFPDVGTILKLRDVHGYEYEKRISLEKGTLERVRDVFCFCCFTGLRFSDVENLKRTNIFPTYIHITTIKDSDGLKIELNKYSRAILDKYRYDSFPGGKVLPVISETGTNEQLKEMGEICGFNEAVPVHLLQRMGACGRSVCQMGTFVNPCRAQDIHL